MSQKFFYDGQIRRFIMQFIRIISEFEVEFGKDRAGNKTLQRVPVFYGDSSRQAAYIIRGGSENAMPTVPAMAVYISSLSYARDRVQEPNYVDTMQIRQRYYNESTHSFENHQGDAFTIERLMPVPYTLELKVDIWTSNTEQKLQLIEQLGVLFNPGLEIQSTDNYIDWTSLSIVFLSSVSWSSRSVGSVGTENPIDIATLTFELPIWISAPAKVKKLGVIQKIISSIHDSQGNLSEDVYLNTNLMGTRQYFTPMDYSVLLIGNELTLLKVNEIEQPRESTIYPSSKTGTKDFWRNLIDVYGVLNNGVSLVRLMLDDEITEVVGTVSYHPTDETILLFNPDVDTLPANTMPPINAIVDPRKPTAVALAESAISGTRFLILNDIGSFNSIVGTGALAWKGTDGMDLVAHANDVIEYNGTHWIITFDSHNNSNIQFVSNLNTGTQYVWNKGCWMKSWEGEYKNGRWTLVL